MNARRGLRRIGLRTWEVVGDRGRWIIERCGAHDWRIKPEDMPRPFFHESHPTLYAARVTAEGWAGALPFFLDRRAA